MKLFTPCKECVDVEKRSTDCLMMCLSNIIEALRVEMKAEEDWWPFFNESKSDYPFGFGFKQKGWVKE